MLVAEDIHFESSAQGTSTSQVVAPAVEYVVGAQGLQGVVELESES